MRAITSRMSNGRRVSCGITPYSSSAAYSGSARRAQRQRHVLLAVEAGDDVARDRQRMGVVLGEVVGHAGDGRMDVGAAQLLGIDHFARGGLHQRRAAQENRALLAHDDGLVAHRRHIGAAGRARAHHHGDLRDAQGRHARLVVEDAAEMLLVGKHLVLQRQEGAAGIDQVDAGQAVLQRDFLRAQMLLHRHREIGAALDGGVVGDDHHFDAVHPADAGDDAGGGRRVVVHAVGGQRRRTPGTASRDRAGRECVRAAAACRGQCACREPFRRRLRRCAPARDADRPPGRAIACCWPGNQADRGSICEAMTLMG